MSVDSPEYVCSVHGTRVSAFHPDGCPDCMRQIRRDWPAPDSADLQEATTGAGAAPAIGYDPARPGGDRSAITFSIPLTPEQSAVLDRPGAMEYLQGMLEYRLSRWLSCNAARVTQEMFMGRE